MKIDNPYFTLNQDPPPNDPPAHVVPENYTFTPPEGQQLDDAVVKEVTEFAKANRMSQEQASAYLGRELQLRANQREAAPEAYEFAKIKVKNEQGQEVETEVEAELAADVSALAKELGLSSKQAQAIMDRELKLASEANAEHQNAVKTLKDKWLGEAKQIKELVGDDGQQFDANIAIGKRALEKFFPEIAKDANSHPFLDHPQVLKGLLQIGKLIGPDGEFVSGGGSGGNVDPEKVLFPSMN